MVTINSTEYLNSAAKEYAIYVAQHRAIPKIADGLKDGQRKMLYLMRNRVDKIKTVSLSGCAIQEGLFLHGDASASESISALAAPFINNMTFLDGIGTFGSRLSPTAWGQPRYTYVKKSKAADNILFADLDFIPMKDNYDGSTKEPVHFLPLIPTVLLNGVSGIAVGWSTEILPHKLEDLILACEQALDNKKIKELAPYYNQYKFVINRIEGNSWEFKGIVDKIDDSTIRVLELPIDLNIEKFKDRLNDLEDLGKIKDYTDRSTDQISITIHFKKNEIKGWSNEQLIDFLSLRSRKTERIVVIDWNNTSIRQYENPELVVLDFVAWRLKWYRTRYENLLKIARNDLNYYKAIEECFKQKLPQKILGLSNKQAVRDLVLEITKEYNLENEQIEKIVSMPSYRWAIDCLKEVQEKMKELIMMIDLYVSILADEKEIKKIYKQELQDLKKVKF